MGQSVYNQSNKLTTSCYLLIVCVAIQIVYYADQVDGLIEPGGSQRSPYYGTYIGKLDTSLHNVAGDVFSVDENTIFIKGFSYDGTAPDAYFWAGTTTNPDVTGFIVPDEKGSTKPLGAYTAKDIVLRLPEGKTFRDIKWFSVWCRKFKANFGHINIPRNLIIPTPVEIRPLSQLDHGVKSGSITIVDAQTFLINDFHYDGQGPAGYWWATAGSRQSSSGLRLKDENGSDKPLRRYSGETLVISLPEGKTIWDYDWIGVWCEEYQVDFGNTRIPQNIRVPPSPKMLGVKPESKLNCEVLYDQLGFELRWVMDGDDIVMQLVGKIEPNEYMAFGLSKDDSKSNMVGADSVVTWFDSNGKGHAVDYYLGSKEQCVGTSGSCPDLKYSGASDSITLLHAALVNGFTLVTFKRPQLGVDDRFDQHVYSDGNQAVIWAIGPLNDRDEVSYHRLRSRGNIFIDFARTPKWNCPNSEASSPTTSSSPSSSGSSSSSSTPSSSRSGPGSSSSSSPAPSAYPPRSPKPQSTPVVSSTWDIPPVICPSDYTFRAQIGPVGGKKGYQGITGKVGWGIAWYINGLLVPELTVERGKTYTFIVEGGNDKVHSSRHHPLYITDSPEGGFDHKTGEERSRERIFAGVGITKRGDLVPTAEGRLCEWKIDTRTREQPDDFKEFFDFQRTLSLQCSSGEPGILRWKPDGNTPDIVYYQCYTHRYLGWKIRVVDSCDQLASASITHIYHTPADNNSTRTGLSAQTLDLVPRHKSDKKQRKTGSNNRGRGVNISSPPSITITNNATTVKNSTIRIRPKQAPSGNGDIRFRERKPVLSYTSPYSPFPPRFVTPSMPMLYPSVTPNLPFGPIRPLEMHIGPVPPPPPFSPVPMKRTPVYVRQRLPPPIPPTPPRSLSSKSNKLTTIAMGNKKSTSPTSTTKPLTTVSSVPTVKLATTPKPVSSPSTTTTTTTTKQPTTLNGPAETGLAENLHGGFLPVLINSKGPPTVTTESPRTTFNDLPSTTTKTDSSQTLNRFYDLSRNPITGLPTTGLPYYFSSSAAATPASGNTTLNPIDLNNLSYRPTSDQDKWEKILLPVVGSSESNENTDPSKLNFKETSTLDQVILKMFNQSLGFGNIYPMLHGTDSSSSSEENVNSGEDKKSAEVSSISSSELFDPSSLVIPSSSFISSSSPSSSSLNPNPTIIEKGLTGLPFSSKPIILPTSTVPINLFNSPLITSHPIIDYPFFSSFYPSHYGIAPSSSSSQPSSSSIAHSSSSSLIPSSSVSITPSDTISSQLPSSSYTEKINQQSTNGDHQTITETSTQPIDESFNSGPFDFLGSDGMTLSSSSSSSSSSTSSNGTDDAILSHIMSLIADNAAPPEVKIVSKSDGTSSSTHVEVHHNLSKRSALHQSDHHHNDGYDHDDDHHKSSSSSSSSSTNSVFSGNKVYNYWSAVINSFITLFAFTIFF